MLDSLRDALNRLLETAPSSIDRREATARMKDSLVHARLGLEDLRGGVRQSQQRLAAAREELETTRRRGRLAAEVKDEETVAVAARFEAQQAERVAVLERKLAAQEEELTLAEREVGEMTAELRRAVAGVPSPAEVAARSAQREAAAEVDDLLGGRAGGPDALGADLDGLARARAREAREQDADERLAELKRRMGR
jgi:hypothetical protein